MDKPTAWRISDTTTSAPRALVVSAELHWAHYDRGGVRIAQGSDWSCTPTDAELAEWDAQAPALAARAFALPAEFYVRFFRLPKSGRSRNHNDGRTERGVSVYGPCSYEVAEDAIANLSIQSMVLIAADAPAWIVTGETVGLGSDGEPLLRNVEIIRPITFNGFTPRPDWSAQ